MKKLTKTDNNNIQQLLEQDFSNRLQSLIDNGWRLCFDKTDDLYHLKESLQHVTLTNGQEVRALAWFYDYVETIDGLNGTGTTFFRLKLVFKKLEFFKSFNKPEFDDNGLIYYGATKHGLSYNSSNRTYRHFFTQKRDWQDRMSLVKKRLEWKKFNQRQVVWRKEVTTSLPGFKRATYIHEHFTPDGKNARVYSSRVLTNKNGRELVLGTWEHRQLASKAKQQKSA